MTQRAYNTRREDGAFSQGIRQAAGVKKHRRDLTLCGLCRRISTANYCGMPRGQSNQAKQTGPL